MSIMKLYFSNFFSPDAKAEDKGGDAILIGVDGKWGMIDAGGAMSQSKFNALVAAGKGNTPCTPEDVADTNDTITLMNQLGIIQLEFFIQTHFHYDHAWMTDKIIEQFNPKVFYGVDPTTYPGYTLPDVEDDKTPNSYWDTPTFVARVKAALAAKGKAMTAPTENQVIMLGDAQIKIINTDGIKHSYALQDYNTASLATLITHGTKKFLLCGDSMHHTMQAKAQSIGKVDFVQVSHHGWNKNTSAEMAFALKPTYAICTKRGYYATYPYTSMGLFQLQGSKMYHLESGGTYSLYFESDGTNITEANDEPTVGFTCVSQWVNATVNMNRWYYFGSAGTRANGWVQIEGAWYYFCVPSSLTSSRTGRDYYYGQMYFDEWVKGANGVDWYYVKGGNADTLGKMAKSETLTIDGKSYTFDANGVCTNP